VHLTLEDAAASAHADAASIPLVVAAVTVSAPADGATPQLTAVDQGSGPTGAILLWPIASLAGLLVVVVLGLGALLVRRRRHTDVIDR
jgi:hypothetical protein